MATEIIERPQQTSAVATRQDPDADASPEWKQIKRQAEKLALASLTPQHLKAKMPNSDGTPETEAARRAAWNQTLSNCLLVANQAYRWGADVFAVAGETYVVQNKLGYQGKLIAAIVNSRGSLHAPLAAIYSTGKGDDFAAVIYGKRDGAVPDEAFDLLAKYADNADQAANRNLARLGVLTIRVSVGQCKTDNKMWRSDPEQKLFYTGSTKWARRHAPELMLGLLTDDDLDYMKQHDRQLQTAGQQRIEALLTPSLDSLPVVPPSAQQDDAEPPKDKPVHETVDAAGEVHEAEPVQEAAEDEDPLAAAYNGLKARIAGCTSVSAVNEAVKAVEADNELKTAPDCVADLKRWAEAKATEIRGRRGEKGNTLPGMG